MEQRLGDCAVEALVTGTGYTYERRERLDRRGPHYVGGQPADSESLEGISGTLGRWVPIRRNGVVQGDRCNARR